MNNTRLSNRRRRGAALVEFALVAPLLFLFICACIEFSRLNMIRNAMGIAAYEGARRGMLPGSTADQAKTVAADAMKAAGITPESIVVTPSVLAFDTELVQVQIQVACNKNLWITPMFSKNVTLNKGVTLSREIAPAVKVASSGASSGTASPSPTGEDPYSGR